MSRYNAKNLKPYDALNRENNKKNPEPKTLQELMQDPQFVSVLLSLTFSLGVFFYFFYRLMHGIREDYRKTRKLKEEAERRARLGLDDEEYDEEGEEEEEEQDASSKKAQQQQKKITAPVSKKDKKESDDEDEVSNKKPKRSTEKASSSSLKKDDNKDDDGTETMRKRNRKKSAKDDL